MESGEVKPADSEPDRSAATPLDDQKGVTEPVNRISSMSGHHDEVPVQGFDSQVNVTDDIGIIRLEEYGIEVHVPSGEAYSAKDITVDVIDEVPPELLTVLRETGATITVGLKMSPSDASFERPVKVTMPHCGVFQKPESAQIVTYYRKNASESFTAIPSTNGNLRCNVRQRDLDIYLNHFSESWIVALFTWAFIGKRVICTPYIPASTPKNARHHLYLHVRNENFRKRETIPESEITHLPENEVSFIVDTRNVEEDEIFLWFILQQRTTKKILVNMCLQESAIGEITQRQGFSIPQRPIRSTSLGIQAAPKGATSDIPTLHHRLSGKNYVEDKHIIRLAKLLTPDLWGDLHVALDIDYSIAEKIRVENSNPMQQYVNLLQRWKLASPRTIKELNKILIEIDAGGLVDKYT
nr:uncharacterized protein LOC129279506 [Lytechinus pictus]